MTRSLSGVARQRLTFPLIGLLALVVLPGCTTATATSHDPIVPPEVQPSHIESPAAATIPVIRAGRYTLIELIADAPQRDLMQQIVEVSFPPPVGATVGEALRYLLMRTGYQLCDSSPANETLDSWPLPAAHLHLGPLTLRQTLEVIVGPAWTLQVDESTRRVCFIASHEPAPHITPVSMAVPAIARKPS